MKFFNYYIVISALLLSVFAKGSKTQDTSTEETVTSSDETLDVGQGPGKVANTDTTKYAGVYNFTYFFNNDKNAKAVLLPCQNVTDFTLDIPAGEGVDIGKDFSKLKNEMDPIYKTSQSSWVVKELALGKEFDTLKISLFIEDSEEVVVCWTVKMTAKKQMIINLNPNNVTECPTKLIPSTKTCKKNLAFLSGTCVSGACTGDGSKPREDNLGTKKNTTKASSANLSSTSLAFTLVTFFLILFFLN